MRHFSQHVRRGAIRVSSESDDGHLAHVAFRNMDGTYVLVLTNTDGDREVTIKTGGASVRVTMEQNSMTTLSWS
jgi:glucosylceramidase